MRIIVSLLFLATVLSLVPSVNAQTSDSARVAVCLPPYPVVASTNTGAGFINFCVYYPENVQPAEQFSVSSVLTAPTTVAPVFIAAGSAFTANFGCTEGTPTVGVPTTNGVVGTMWTAVTTFTMSAGSERCDFIASITMTVAAVPLQIYSSGIESNVHTENLRLDNFNYLCDAPAIAPNAYSTTATTCNDPNLSIGQTTPWAMNVNITNDETDDGLLTTPVGDFTGNNTFNATFPSTLDVNAHFPGDTQNLGLDAWTTAWFWIAAVLFFSYMGWLVALSFAIPGLLASLIPSIKTTLDGLGLDFEAIFMLCLLGFILELAANRFSWGGYVSGTRRLRLVGA